MKQTLMSVLAVAALVGAVLGQLVLSPWLASLIWNERVVPLFLAPRIEFIDAIAIGLMLYFWHSAAGRAATGKKE